MNLNDLMTSNARPYDTHRGIGKEQARQLALAKRQNVICSGQKPVVHMAGSFGYK